MMQRSARDHVAAACSALSGVAFFFAPLLDPQAQKIEIPTAIYFAAVAALGPALITYYFFPKLGRGGVLGLLHDAGLGIVAAVMSMMFVGTLIIPGIGTVMAPVFVLHRVYHEPTDGLILGAGVIAVLLLSRANRPR